MARKKIEIVLIEVSGEQVEAKECTKCGEVKALSEYYSGKRGVGGKRSQCKICSNSYHKDYYNANEERLILYHRNENNKWYKENREYKRCRNSLWNQANKGKRKMSEHRRKARKRQLPDTLTTEQTAELVQRGCALTGAHDDIHLDHFIPLSWGHGGTIVENMIPLDGWLNISKNDRNPFEWIKREDVQQRIDLRKWYETIEYLAELNDMTTQQYEEYVYWCEENKRDLVSA